MFRSMTVSSLILAVVMFAFGCSKQVSQTGQSPSADSVTVVQVAADSVSVLDLLRSQHDVDYLPSVSGAFVTAIDSIKTGGGCFWTYKVNDSTIPVACDKYTVAPGDTVIWHFRASR